MNAPYDGHINNLAIIFCRICIFGMNKRIINIKVHKAVNNKVIIIVKQCNGEKKHHDGYE